MAKIKPVDESTRSDRKIKNPNEPSELSPGIATSALLNEDQAAARLGLTTSDLYQRRRRGDGPPFVRLKNRIFYVTADLDAWVAALQRFQSSTEGYAAQRLAGAALAKRQASLSRKAGG